MANPGEFHSYRDNKALAEVKVLVDGSTILGLPNKVFVFCGIIGAGLILNMSGWWAKGAIFLLTVILYYVMYYIHADDPRAMEVWQRSLSRPARWSAGVMKTRKIYFLQTKE